VVKSAADLKQVFTYYPKPVLPTEYQFANVSGTRVYRLTIDPQGAVTHIQILKRMDGSVLDATNLKHLFVGGRNPPKPHRRCVGGS
jgi:hypothetical protein